MSWTRDTTLSWTELIAVKILKSGSVPKHVAILMDGSRRYARRKGIPVIEGQTEGFHTMVDAVRWCLHLGIPELTVYACSIYNLKRTEHEVTEFMELVEQKFGGFLSDREKMMKCGVRVRVIGDWSFVSEKLRPLMAAAMLMTKDNNKIFLNIAFAYTSRNEVTHAVKDVLEGIENANLLLEDISEVLISECLYTNKLSEPDLVIRTSGEVRFSDFMTWKTSWSCVYFTAVMWPDLRIWHVLAAVFYYQRCRFDLEVVRRRHRANSVTDNSRVITFVNNLMKERERMIENHSMGSTDTSNT